jgi:hypothetical protein
MKTEPREVWVQRVQRLADSGMTAKAFASEIGVNVHTLTGWKWKLSREAIEASLRPAKAQFVDMSAAIGRATAAASPLPSSSSLSVDAFEVVLRNGLRVRVPSAFDPRVLHALVATLEVA